MPVYFLTKEKKMSKILTLLVLALTLMGFNSSSFAAKDEAKAADAAEQGQMTAEEAKNKDKKKKKKKGDEEEPECD